MNRIFLYLSLILGFVFSYSTNSYAQAPEWKFEVKNDTYDFGTVVDGDTVVYNYEFTNTGQQPLIIYKAEVGCNCTSADWPKRPVMPGQKGSIKVTFKSEGNVGKINKTIYIKSNAKLPEKYKSAYELTLVGNVKPKK